MHSINLHIDDTIYEKFKALLDLMPKNKVQIISDETTEKASFFVSSNEEVRKRVQVAEERGNYTEHEKFWTEMDEYIESSK